MTRNQPPASVFEALRRLLHCNKTELAQRLNVSPATLRRWEAEGISTNAAALNATSGLLIDVLREAGNADLLAQGYFFRQRPGGGMNVATLPTNIVEFPSGKPKGPKKGKKK